MSRRRKGHGCGITVLVLLFIFILAGGGLGVLFAKKYMPSNELADKSRVFGIKGGQVALILDNQVQEEKGIYEDGQVYLPVNWVNEHLNERFYWDEGEKLLVYALPESIVYADESTQGEKGPLFKVTQEGMYLSLGVVVNYTDIRTQAFATSQIKRVGYHSDYEYQYDRDSVNVVIRGLKEDLDQLSSAALGAEMDVEDMVPGENSGEITFQLGDAYELVSYDRIQVTVTEKGPSADSTAASTNESQEGTESETSEGPAGTSKAEPGQ